ncbi:unnamed protein product [Owenia fusiformis]|uniref:Uncharacterized protein n=1 Tax=Owenia fusiformis TaxID=6347 RepID=A0A8J1U7C0_OWEFU|nr:unnamed protein product [Owenia fusiformis]
MSRIPVVAFDSHSEHVPRQVHKNNYAKIEKNGIDKIDDKDPNHGGYEAFLMTGDVMIRTAQKVKPDSPKHPSPKSGLPVFAGSTAKTSPSEKPQSKIPQFGAKPSRIPEAKTSPSKIPYKDGEKSPTKIPHSGIKSPSKVPKSDGLKSPSKLPHAEGNKENVNRQSGITPPSKIAQPNTRIPQSRSKLSPTKQTVSNPEQRIPSGIPNPQVHSNDQQKVSPTKGKSRLPMPKGMKPIIKPEVPSYQENNNVNGNADSNGTCEDTQDGVFENDYTHTEEIESPTEQMNERTTSSMVNSYSAEKVSYSQMHGAGGLVRNSKSHENYLESGGQQVMTVDIDIDDVGATSYDALPASCEQSSLSLDRLQTRLAPVESPPQSGTKSLDNSPERRPGFVNIENDGERGKLSDQDSIEEIEEPFPPPPAPHELTDMDEPMQTDSTQLSPGEDKIASHLVQNILRSPLGNTLEETNVDSKEHVTKTEYDAPRVTVFPSHPEDASPVRQVTTATAIEETAVRRDSVPSDQGSMSPTGYGSMSPTSPSSPGESDHEFSDSESIYHQPIKTVDVASAQRLAKRLYQLDGFKKSDVARHLSKKNDFSYQVADEYLLHFDFTKKSIDGALRDFLNQFSLTGETQERERVLAHFSHRYMICNPGSFNSEDACHTLTCAIMLLNTDLHGQNIGKKMTCAEFIENLSELNDGENFPKDVLKSVYSSIKNESLEWAPDEEVAEMLYPDPSIPLGASGAQPEHDAFVGNNPFLETPNPESATDYKKGYVMRKCCTDPDGRKTPFGKRGWKMFYATLKDMVLYLHKDEHGFKKNSMYENMNNAIRIHHALATKATDYSKKQYVFRLQTADWAEYLFQTSLPDSSSDSDSKELQEWIDTINLVAASLSSPPLAAGCGSQKKFQRPLLPASYTRCNLREQLTNHEHKVLDLERELSEHKANPPEKGAKSRYVSEYLEKEQYLEFELRRFKTYAYLLSSKMAAFPELEPSLVETTIGEVEEPPSPPVQEAQSALNAVKELIGQTPGITKTPGIAAPPVVNPVQRSLSDRYSYRAAIYKTDADIEMLPPWKRRKDKTIKKEKQVNRDSAEWWL